ncbi:MAG: DUF924 family protein, partial [Polyangiaceae bacterium]|nr:DUF924 family protein [Polyangiaceae bacterium]
ARSWRTGVRKHLDLLERFGRYPSHNAARGRLTTPAEAAFLARPEFTALFPRTPKASRRAGSQGAERPGAEARPVPAGPRLRVLVLHGFRQNGEVLRRRTRKMRDALDDAAEFVFVTSPMAYAPRGDDRDGTIAAFGEVPDYPMQRAWWLANEDSAVYEGFDASIAFLENVFRTQGPFDGVLGFSQGGTMAAVLAAMLPHPSIAFRFAICVSSFPSRAKAHAAYVRPGSVRVPSLHVLGLNDLLVTPDRSIALLDVFDRSTSTLVKHAGGHFVPNAWPYGAIRSFLSGFLAGATTPPAPAAPAALPPGDGPYERACEALSAGAPLPAGALRELAERQQWKELQALAMLASQRGTAPGVHDAIVALFANQLTRDLRVAAALPAYGDEAPAAERARRLFGVLARDTMTEGEEPLPSLCARLAPRIGSQTDKACRLARGVARAMFPEHEMRAVLAAKAQRDATPEAAVPINEASRRRGPRTLDEPAQIKHLTYQRYKQVLSLLNGVLNEIDPAQASRRARRLHQARVVSPEAITALQSRPLSTHVIEPEPEPVVPCTLDDLSPLLAHLRSNAGVPQQTAFHKGTLTTDGRLDLCKQVVGPEGIKPLLGAMMHSDRVKRLLLGNNVVGDSGAEAIASFLRERRNSPLECWYIAGNQIGPEGLRHLCDALAGDERVTSLWLKRNPLKPAGMASLATLLRHNRAIEVLDVVNCGLLDEGLATLLGALHGPGANRTLKHLYVGTNGVTERSAPLLAELLAGDCALESLYLSCNRLGDGGAEAIAKALRSNHRLRRLSLASNRVGPRGANALAEALAGHPSLELLDLGFTKATNTVGELGNFLGDEGARAIARMLEHNQVLRVLDLLHNFITQIGVNHLRDALEVNRSLLSLQLTQFGRVHNEPGKEAIRAALDRNRGFVPPEQADRVAKIEFPDHVLDIYSVYRTRSLTPPLGAPRLTPARRGADVRRA